VTGRAVDQGVIRTSRRDVVTTRRILASAAADSPFQERFPGRAIASKGGNHATLTAIAEGISCTALIWGAMLCTLNALVGSIACHLHRQARAGG
jgi:hypothetical protein